MKRHKLSGLIAAAYTPMKEDGRLDLEQIQPMVAHLSDHHVDGLYVCGTTGEGMSLTSNERRQVAKAYVDSAVSRQLPVVVQVGHNSLFEARDLAIHAAEIGADSISANAPSYFKITDVEALVDSMEVIASGAPALPFYYYHIPMLTGASVDVHQFLEAATDRIPNLVGVKYTAHAVHEFQRCIEWQDGRYDILWGADEMLLAALSAGGRGAVGSTYNVAAPLYQRVIHAFDAGEIAEARTLLSKAINMTRIIYQYPFHSAMKSILGMLGVQCGPCRLPQDRISSSQVAKLRSELEEIGFFEWSQPIAI